jgi:hypothetical protein
MKTLVSSALVIAMSSSVFAAPVAGQPTPGAPPSVTLQLSADDQELLARGPISTGEHIGGGVAALFLGFGIGHAVQGRWSDRGWIFTLGETASLGLMIYGLTRTASCTLDATSGGSCSDSGLGWMAGGAIALTGLHIWETIDAFVAPVGHNRRFRAAELRAGRPMYSTLTPYVTPAQTGDGAIGGLSLRF